jgi:hypothetical protein
MIRWKPTVTDNTERDKYIADWCKQIGVPANAWNLVEYMVKIKNYDTAVGVMFELSWRHHRDYLDRASKVLKEWAAQYSNAPITANDLYNFMTYYIANNEELPK